MEEIFWIFTKGNHHQNAEHCSFLHEAQMGFQALKILPDADRDFSLWKRIHTASLPLQEQLKLNVGRKG